MFRSLVNPFCRINYFRLSLSSLVYNLTIVQQVSALGCYHFANWIDLAHLLLYSLINISISGWNLNFSPLRICLRASCDRRGVLR